MQKCRISIKETILEIYLISNFKSQVTAWLDPQFSEFSHGFTFLYVILHGNKWQRYFWFSFFWNILLIDKWKTHMQKTIETFQGISLTSTESFLATNPWGFYPGLKKIPGIFTSDFRISIVILHASKKKVLGSHLTWNGLSTASHYYFMWNGVW